MVVMSRKPMNRRKDLRADALKHSQPLSIPILLEDILRESLRGAHRKTLRFERRQRRRIPLNGCGIEGSAEEVGPLVALRTSEQVAAKLKPNPLLRHSVVREDGEPLSPSQNVLEI